MVEGLGGGGGVASYINIHTHILICGRIKVHIQTYIFIDFSYIVYLV